MATDESKRTFLSYWWVLPVAGTLSAFGYMARYAAKVTFGKHAVGAPKFVARPRQQAAKLADLNGPYSTVDFVLGDTPCVVVELPKATPDSLAVSGRHFAAFSRMCTHLGCPVNMIRDTEVLALTFNYRADHPMLGCPCHFSVFDATEQGQALFGKALYPLPRVRLSESGGVLYADGLEPNPQAQTPKS